MESEKCIDNQLSEISYSEGIIDEESRQKLKLGIIKIHKPISYYVVGYFAYVMALIPFAYLVTFIDEIDTGSTYFAKLYERDTFYTTHFSFGKLFYWVVLNVIGFSFVVVVNLGNYRKDPFTSNDGSHKDIKILFPVSFFLFFMSSMVFLRDKYDMERNCPTISQEFLGNAYEKGIIQNSSFQLNSYEIVQSPSQVNETVLVILLNNIAQLFELNGQTECHIYDRMEVFKYNCFYLIVFFIGLNFTHLDNPPFNNITLEWDIMKNWPWYLWMIFAGIVSFIFINIGFLFKLYISSGVATNYALMLIAIPIGIAVITHLLSKTRKLHIHHYFIGLFVVLFVGYQSYYVAALSGIFTGIMIEGASRWGFSTLWEPLTRAYRY